MVFGEFWSRAYSFRQERSDSGRIAETNVIWKKELKNQARQELSLKGMGPSVGY